jgi:hypothetical protein
VNHVLPANGDFPVELVRPDKTGDGEIDEKEGQECDSKDKPDKEFCPEHRPEYAGVPECLKPEEVRIKRDELPGKDKNEEQKGQHNEELVPFHVLRSPSSLCPSLTQGWTNAVAGSRKGDARFPESVDEIVKNSSNRSISFPAMY